MQAYYSSQAPAAGGSYYGGALATTAQQPPHPYAMWPGQAIMPYGAPPPSFYPGALYGAHPPYTMGAGGAPNTSENGRPRGAGGSVDGETGEAGAGSLDASGRPTAGNGLMGSNAVPGQRPPEVGASNQPPPGEAGPGASITAGPEYWVPTPQGGAAAHAPASMTAAGPGPHAVAGSELWLQQDEREVKRQRRKQSNRESARRSRLRKQGEVEELANRVDTLTSENMSLRNELVRLTDAITALKAEKDQLQERMQGSDVSAAPAEGASEQEVAVKDESESAEKASKPDEEK